MGGVFENADPAFGNAVVDRRNGSGGTDPVQLLNQFRRGHFGDRLADFEAVPNPFRQRLPELG